MPLANTFVSRTAIAILAALALNSAADAAGWVHKFPPNLVQPDSGRRNHIFFVGDPIKFKLDGRNLDRFEVRDYWGNLIDQGAAAATIEIKQQPTGWYKLYIYGKKRPPEKPKSELESLLDEPKSKPDPKKAADKDEPTPGPAKTGPTNEEIWGDIIGGTMFVVFRHNANFPELPAAAVSGGGDGSMDQVLRGVVGMGPQRHKAIAEKPEETIKQLAFGVEIDKRMYLPFDPVRPRALMMAFPNGTGNTAGVKQIVEHFRRDVGYYEPRNEPNFGSSGADFVTKELKPFHELIKGVDPKLKVLGPGTVSIGPNGSGLLWIEDFLKAGGAKYIDAFSFHAYNAINGDLWLARKSLDSLDELLRKYDMGDIEKWQTEQGFFACVYGSYQPRLQGRWTMLEMMVFEQYGLPKEHNHLWYDRSHGFWDFPTWFENDDGSLNPAAPLMRIWSEELFGTKFAKRYDFGEPGNRLYIGSLFAGPNKRVAAFQSAGSTDGSVHLKVTGGDALRIVSAFGIEGQVAVKDGRAVVPTPELPVYVELADGQEIEVIATDWGTNLARRDGVVVTASGAAEHPVDKTIENPTTKVINGELENWYWSQQKNAQPWMSNVEEFPAWVEIDLGRSAQTGRVVVFAAPPWQWQGTLVDYELQYDAGGKWISLERVVEPVQTFTRFTPPTRTSVDSFFSDRWIFQHQFKPVTTQKIRLLVHEVTWGGGATEAVPRAGGQTGPHQIMLREVEVYER